MTRFISILYDSEKAANPEETSIEPPFFPDLNLDQIFNAITKNQSAYNLLPLYYSPPRDLDTINYRQDVFRDLENPKLLNSIKTFTAKMVLVHRYLKMIDSLYYYYHQEGWFLEAVKVYCDAVACLAEDLSDINLYSQGFLDFREYLKAYVESEEFRSLQEEAKDIAEKMSTVQYNIHIRGNLVRVRKSHLEIDYSVEVQQTFEKFKQGEVKTHIFNLAASAGMNHVEAQILECVAKLYPEYFQQLDQFCLHHHEFLAEPVTRFEREIQFYVAYLDYCLEIRSSGLKFSLPKINDKDKSVYVVDGFDLALANKCHRENLPVVTNDFLLKDKERIIIVSGPNQGGKTTFARMFGQIHYLGSLGLPVPGSDACIFLYDQIYTHFEKEENVQSLRGKLQDELIRIHDILDKATTNSIIIINEIFTSTTLKDAVFLGKQIMWKIINLDLICVFVSFVDELTTLGDGIVSMVSTIVPENPTLRTFKIIRNPADGLAYASFIAEKHHLTYRAIKERIKP